MDKEAHDISLIKLIYSRQPIDIFKAYLCLSRDCDYTKKSGAGETLENLLKLFNWRLNTWSNDGCVSIGEQIVTTRCQLGLKRQFIFGLVDRLVRTGSVVDAEKLIDTACSNCSNDSQEKSEYVKKSIELVDYCILDNELSLADKILERVCETSPKESDDYNLALNFRKKMWEHFTAGNLGTITNIATLQTIITRQFQEEKPIVAGL